MVTGETGCNRNLLEQIALFYSKVRKEMASPIDLSSIVNMIMQLLPVIIILAILPLFIRLFTGLFKE